MAQYKNTLAFWNAKTINSESNLDLALDNFRILFAYHSGKIENTEITYHDTREIFENGKVLGFSGNPRTLFEQQNQKLCYEFLKQKIVAREALSEALVLETHSILTSGTFDERRYLDNGERPGEYKKHDYVTGRNEVGSPFESVAEDIAELLSEINGYSGKEVLKSAAYFHAAFENIHPFADGNGRVGRTLMNYYLMTHGHPPIVIYDEDKVLYYESLEKYDMEETLDPLCRFLQYETERTWQTQLELSNGQKRQRPNMDQCR